jgi:AAA domain
MTLIFANEHPSDAHKLLAKYHSVAVGAEGVLVLSVIDTAGKTRPQKFAIGEAQIMADEGMARGQAANAYFGPAIMRRDLAHDERGGKEDVIGITGLVIDADADTGKSVVLPPGIEPTFIVTTCRVPAVNRHIHFVFTRLLTPQEGSVLAALLHQKCGGDHGTKDIAHVWRLPGTKNIPGDTKLRRGRPKEPQAVELAGGSGEAVDPDALRKVLMAMPDHPSHRSMGNGHDHRAVDVGGDWQMALAALPESARFMITSPPTPSTNRSALAASVITILDKLGWSRADIAAVIRANPQGIGARYLEDKNDLEADIRRVLGKFETERKNDPPKRLRLSYFDDCQETVAKRWIMKGLFARGETSSWIAPPGAGKSALLTCLAVYVAASKDWRGFRCKEKCGVLYLAFERADLVKRRLAVYAKQGFKGLPIAIGDQIVDLMDSNAPDMILAAIREAEERLGVQVGLVIIDTYAKGIAVGGGDEDKARDQGRCLANLRRLQEVVNVHIAIIGHTGKDESRGARGSNAHVADTDVQVQISGDGAIKTAKVIKANDQPTGVLLQFTMRSEAMGYDEDGDEISVGVLTDEEISAPTAGDKGQRLSPRERRAVKALTEVVLNSGKRPAFDWQLPADIKVVSLDDWLAELKRSDVIEAGDPNPRTSFGRIKNGLANKGWVGIRDGQVWATRL